MKAKSNFSQLAKESTAKGAIVMVGGIAVFIAGFVIWSASGMVGAIVTSLM